MSKETDEPFPLSSVRDWFKIYKRAFPWRENRSLYRVLVSEFMLQQTRASHVVGYYKRWMERFPSPQDFLEASEEEAIKLWEGLGYYSRVRRMREAVFQVVQKEDWDQASLMQLPGMGLYTATAVACFSLRDTARLPIDANVSRVLCRFWGVCSEVSSVRTKKILAKLWKQKTMASSVQVEDLEGLIELGALICTSRSPKCAQCPLQASCYALRNNLVERLPVKKPPPCNEVCFFASAVMMSGEKIWIVPSSMIRGLWEFPTIACGENELPENVWRPFLGDRPFVRFPKIIYRITRFVLHLTSVLIHDVNLETHVPSEQNGKWISIIDLVKYSFSSGHRKLLEKILLHCQIDYSS